MRIRTAGTVPRIGAALVAAATVQLAWVATGAPGALVVSDSLFVVSSAFAAVSGAAAVRRLQGRARRCWAAFAAGWVALTVGNGIWFTYEVILGQAVPAPSLADWFFSAALLLPIVGAVGALVPLVPGRVGGLRVLLDVLVTGGSLLLLSWVTVLGPVLEDRSTEVLEAVTWLYGPFGIVVATVTLATMTRISARARLPWLLLGTAYLVGAAVDVLWAYATLTDGFAGGSPIDPLWTIAYGLLGLAGVAVRGDAGLGTSRVAPTRSESLAAHVPVSLVVAAAAVQHARGRFTSPMIGAGLVLVAVLVLRQVLAILENHQLARTLESRVAERTAELRSSEERFRSIVANISDVILLVDDDFVIRYQSPAVERVLGYGPDELIGVDSRDLSHPDELDATRNAYLAGREVLLLRARHKDGSWRRVETTLTDLRTLPAVGGIVLALRDIEERILLEEELRHQAYHDALTGLANRARLHEALGALLEGGRRPSLLLIDLDEFKAVNDTAGHDLGDEVLVAVAQRLVESTRPGDLVARLGGDEFAIVLRDDPHALAGVAVADRALHALRMPLYVQGRQVRCLGSIGVAATGADPTPAALLRDADVAMYVAKARGKGRIELFTEAMREAVVRRQGTEDLLRRAVAQRRLVLHHQPVVDLRTGTVVGVEALLRLRHDDGHLMPPGEFVPIAEETGLIVEIGAWVLREACRIVAEWQALRPDGPPLGVAVNVSTVQLRDAGLERAVAAALAAAGLPAGLLTLEITEGALGPDDDGVDDALAGLRDLGVRLSIDDFGAGYSSLARLRELPVDEVKVDRAFVSELRDGEAPVLEAILALASRLGLAVVAEGIETDEQAAQLRGTTCERGQGYRFSPPLPPAELARLITGAELSA